MNSKAGNSTSTQNEDPFCKCDLYTILLYTYEWKINNIRMINSSSKPIISPVFPVASCKNYDLKFFITSTGYESIKIEMRLIKECRITREMKIKEANCPLTQKLKKYILRLEFLDNTGNIIDYYKSLPYEYKLINTSVVYAWTKEENVSRFIQNDSLSIRVKLSMRFYEDTSEKVATYTDETTKCLENDMTNFFNKRNYSPDILIKIGCEYVPCHKSIIYSQYPNFGKLEGNDNSTKQAVSSLKLPNNISSIICDNCEILDFSNENSEVLLPVLYFIYTKQIQDLQTIDYFAVHEFAKKYGIRELSMLLMPSEIKVSSKIVVNKLNYTWYVEKFSSLLKNGVSHIHSPEFKTEIGNEVITWNVMACLDSYNMVFNLKRINGAKTNVYTLVKFRVCDAYGLIHEEREFKFLFPSGITNNCFRFTEPESHIVIASDLLYNDTLAVHCDLTVSCGELSSDIEHCYPSAHPNIDTSHWIKNFQRLFETEILSDTTLIAEEKAFKVHRSILAARSPVFARMFESDMEEKRSGCVRIKDASSAVMKQALCYIYTCKVEDLTLTQALELYRIADKYEILDLRSKCSEFMVQHLDAESSCEFMIIADLFSDEILKKAAKNVICRNAAQALLSPHGIELMTNHRLLAQDILKTLSAIFCSLPPQDATFSPNKRSASSLEDDKHVLTELKIKNPKFKRQNLDAESSCEFLIIADIYNDENLKVAAKDTICRNAVRAFLSPGGTELISNHFLLAHDILEHLSAAFCSFLT